MRQNKKEIFASGMVLLTHYWSLRRISCYVSNFSVGILFVFINFI